MGEALKVLGQQAPAATTLTALYTVPASTSATCSTLSICNQNAAKIKARVSVAVAGAADIAKQYLVHDLELLGHESAMLTLGVTLAATDVVRCYADTTNVSFNLFGVEVT